jgi:hypothetical protein
VDKLIRTGLLEEVRANGSLLAWRRDAEAGPMALRITKEGLEAISDYPQLASQCGYNGFGEGKMAEQVTAVLVVGAATERNLDRPPSLAPGS